MGAAEDRAGKGGYRCRGVVIIISITDLPNHGTQLQHMLHRSITITMAWSALITSRVVLPVWDWTEIGGQGGAFTIKLKVRKR